MADEQPASIHQLHHPPKKVPKTAAERARDCRARKKAKKLGEAGLPPQATDSVGPLPANDPPGHKDVELRPTVPAADVLRGSAARAGHQPGMEAVGTDVVPQDADLVVGPVSHRQSLSHHSTLLQLAAVGLGAVGMTMNAWYARSLGSSEIAGWLFLAIGAASDLVALCIPPCAARQWHAGNRATAAVAWVLWWVPFVFAVTAGIGFASVNITDVTAARASRVTPAVVTARNALADAVTARDRECAGGVGRYCRQREDVVMERRRALDAATRNVEQAADPQIEAASRIVTWVTSGWLKPTGDDFAMVRLVLLALLPQLGGILLMVARPA
jgi:hypothetical protein